nr:hypothetical protein [Tanacetum cinerariifolium]
KSNAAEGFEQIIDFLSGSHIHYAFIVNPHIYISCIKQFWNTASVKRSADVTSQWKFLIHTILQSLSAKRTSWNEFSTAMASAVICLSKGQKFNFSKRIENLENDKAAQKLEIIKLKVRVKRLEMANKVKSSKLRRLRKVGA